MVLGVSGSNLSALYRQQATDYSKVLEQISSGKRFTKPSDDFASFTKVRSAETDAVAYQRVNDDLVRAKEKGSIVSTVGNEIYEALEKMKGMSVADMKKSATELANLIKANISDLNVTGGYKATANLTSATAPELVLDINVGGAAGLYNGLLNALEGAGGINHSGTSDDALAETARAGALTAARNLAAAGDSFNGKVDRQLTINQNIIAAKENSASAIGAIDEVSAISKATALQVRQQATISMASQANLSQLNLARLFQ